MNGRWRPLPASLDLEIVHLVTVLRELKDRSGLSLAQLAVKTTYSKSSWERYLNGVTLPPRHAVETLGRLTGEPVDRLVALWERAETHWSKPESTARPVTPVPGPASADREPVPARGSQLSTFHVRPVTLLTGGIAAIAVLTILFVLADTVRSVRSPAPAAPMPLTIGCHDQGCTNQEPEDMGCDSDPASYANLRVGTAYLELRISDRCAAAWARISRSAVGDRVAVVNQNGQTENAIVADSASTGQYVHTRMIVSDRHSHLRACVDRRGGEHRCTPWGAQNPLHP